MLGEDSLADVYVAEEARVEDAVWLDGDNLGDVDTVVEVPKVLDIFEECLTHGVRKRRPKGRKQLDSNRRRFRDWNKNGRAQIARMRTIVYELIEAGQDSGYDGLYWQGSGACRCPETCPVL
ncbi:hypothetical protein M8818_001163 [Zalaria obscura]|uniref:Uncharacterized protein n=1 Tax=Zalaria obscura TaxID=2024903 RepID=A0ACC3SKE3_9PEZI